MDEQLKYTSLPEAFSRVMTDLADLIQKKMRLARAELSTKLSIGIRAGASGSSIPLNEIRKVFCFWRQVPCF
jgi:hypothetical protein